MANIFTEPLIFQNGTGFVINPNNTEIFSNQTVVFSNIKWYSFQKYAKMMQKTFPNDTKMTPKSSQN